MRKSILGIITLLALALFIASCTPAAQYYICSDGRKVDNPSMCPPPTTPETPKAEAVPENSADETMISADAQKLFSNLPRVKNITFAYVESPDVLPTRLYYASREKMKVTLVSKEIFSKNNAFDTVYIDLVKMTAAGYCENRDSKICPNWNNEYPVNFDDYYVETPFWWVSNLTKAELTGRSEMIENKNAVEVKFWIKDVDGMMFVSYYYGVPMKVTFGGKTYEFRDIETNTVKGGGLEHQPVAQ